MLNADIWNDPAIVIEKYIANAENSFYRVYFSGGRVIIVKAFSPGPIKKLTRTIPREHELRVGPRPP